MRKLLPLVQKSLSSVRVPDLQISVEFLSQYIVAIYRCKQTLQARVNFSIKSFLKTTVKPFLVVFIIYGIRNIIFIGFELRAVAKIVSGKKFVWYRGENTREKTVTNIFLDFWPHRPYFVASEVSI